MKQIDSKRDNQRPEPAPWQPLARVAVAIAAASGASAALAAPIAGSFYESFSTPVANDTTGSISLAGQVPAGDDITLQSGEVEFLFEDTSAPSANYTFVGNSVQNTSYGEWDCGWGCSYDYYYITDHLANYQTTATPDQGSVTLPDGTHSFVDPLQSSWTYVSGSLTSETYIGGPDDSWDEYEDYYYTNDENYGKYFWTSTLTLDNAELESLSNGSLDFTMSSAAGSFELIDVYVDYSGIATPVPEPASASLLSAGLAALGMLAVVRRRKQRQLG